MYMYMYRGLKAVGQRRVLIGLIKMVTMMSNIRVKISPFFFTIFKNNDFSFFLPRSSLVYLFNHIYLVSFFF